MRKRRWTSRRKGGSLTSPESAVGAVVVRDGEVVGRGYHTWAGLQHAEVLALEEAGERARGATLVRDARALRAPRPYAAVHRARFWPQACAKWSRRWRIPIRGRAGRDSCDCGTRASKWRWPRSTPREAAEAERAVYSFHAHRTSAGDAEDGVTLDGKIAAPDDNAGWITSETRSRPRAEAAARSDAILTGIGTVLADDCRLTDRSGLRAAGRCLRIVLDSQLRLPLDSQLVRTPVATCWWSRPARRAAERRKLLESRGVEVLAFDGPGGRADLQSVVDWLGRQRYLSLMIEAGSKLNWSALESGVVDRDLFLLRAEDSGRHGVAAAGRRHRTAPAVGRDSLTQYRDPSDSTGRIRGGRIPDVHRHY